MFMIYKALLKFTKILSHENLEPYSIVVDSYLTSSVTALIAAADSTFSIATS